MTRSRSERCQALLELVLGGSYATQHALLAALSAQGFTVTQSSVSRDIRALGLEKRDGVYVAPRELLAGPGGLEVWQAVTAVNVAGPHMIVLRSLTAMAQAVAAAVDDATWEGVAGTVAGDDTVLIALRDPDAQATLVRRARVLADLA